ncbi:hypothetical protein OIV83_001536 [Microbotryomycetes sp. JL201]|nr:hypothetical protein OIV83_001536 [Microbotryomycetes sp. JL201]
MAQPPGTLRTSSSMTSIAAAARLKRPEHVSHVLVAEFDIDQLSLSGSVLRHEFPRPTGTDEHLLAEHMLPDGVHDRAEDWTVFYLNQIPALTVTSDNSTHGGPDAERSTSNAGPDTRRPAMAGNGLLYVMSLVRTKKDATVRRGALVKAMAVVSHHPFIQVFKPVLVLALEDYFRDPSVECLARVYTAINDMDTSTMPQLTLDERTILRTTDRKDLFEDKFVALAGSPRFANRTLNRQTSASTLGQSTGDVAEVLSPVGERSESYESLSSLASTSKDPNSSTNSIDETDWKHKSRAGTVSSFDDTQTRVAFGVPTAQRHQASLHGGSARKRPKDTHVFDTQAVFRGMPIPIRIPLSTFPEDIGEYSLVKLIQTFSAPNSVASGPQHPHLHTSGPTTAPIIILLNALLTDKRVVFLGHQHAAGHVANLVLAACAMASGGGLLPGIVRRAFPYTNLSNLDNLQQVPGFVAGVCNPAFAERPSWWDVLCNIETGKVIVSKDIAPVSPVSRQFPKMTPTGGVESGVTDDTYASSRIGSDSFDQAFVEEIWSAVQAHYGERMIRARFADYIQRFLRLASRHEEEVSGGVTTIGWPSIPFSSAGLGSGLALADDGLALREMQANVGRIEGWKGTASYALYQKLYMSHRQTSPFPDFDLGHQVIRLRQGRRMPVAEAERLFGTLASQTRSDEQVIAILAQFPSHLGGLVSLAMGFLHASTTVRSYAVDLFEKLDSHPTGHIYVHSLNAYQRMAYERLLRERQQVAADSPKTIESQMSAPSLPPKDM